MYVQNTKMEVNGMCAQTTYGKPKSVYRWLKLFLYVALWQIWKKFSFSLSDQQLQLAIYRQYVGARCRLTIPGRALRPVK